MLGTTRNPNPSKLQSDLARRLGLMREIARELPSDHRFDHPIMIDLTGSERARISPVTQNLDSVAKVRNLSESMRDINDRYPVGLQLTDQPKKIRRLVTRKTARRLIHDDQSRLARERFSNFDHLTLGNRQLAQRSAR